MGFSLSLLRKPVQRGMVFAHQQLGSCELPFQFIVGGGLCHGQVKAGRGEMQVGRLAFRQSKALDRHLRQDEAVTCFINGHLVGRGRTSLIETGEYSVDFRRRREVPVGPSIAQPSLSSASL